VFSGKKVSIGFQNSYMVAVEGSDVFCSKDKAGKILQIFFRLTYSIF